MAGQANQKRIVNRSEDGKGWAVRVALDSPALTTTPLKESAVLEATGQLQDLPTGGELHIFFGDGRPEEVRPIPPSAAREPDVVEQVIREGKKIDKGLEVGLEVFGLLGVSALSASVSPEVQEAAGAGWIAVFFATLTWSAGCALAVILVMKSGLLGWPLAGAIGLGFLGALAFATWLGTGVLDLTAVSAPDNPLGLIYRFAAAAFLTYGPVGALVGGGVGAWLGSRCATLVPENFMES